MKRQELRSFFAKNHRNHRLFVCCVFAFLFLAFETVFSGTTATYSDGHMNFSIHLSVIKIICIFIYLSTSVLIASGVKYRLLLIPDIILLAIKLYTATTEILLLSYNKTLINELSTIENIVESLLFAIFLSTLICGKLLKRPRKFIRNAPTICLWTLALCFPFTIAFESLKFFAAIEVPQQNIWVASFNFIQGIINEAFLDLPYALLILLMYFVPEKTFKAFKNHLLHIDNE